MTHTDLLNVNQLTVQIGTKTLCRTLDLTIRPGEIWGVLGANGSGKTTLLHTLIGLHQPLSGTILLNNKLVTSLQPSHIATQMGIVFQENPTHFLQTVFEFCLTGRYPHMGLFGMPNSTDKEITHQALNMMGLADQHKQKMHTLSGGEKRRLALAAVLTQNPKIYLLDEPTNHLDLRYQHQVLTHFKKLAHENQASVIMSLHQIELVRQYCDHVLLLFENGNIKQGSTHNLLTETHLAKLYPGTFA